MPGFNTNRIAARAGVSIGTLYGYFPNKQSILIALARQLLQGDGQAVLSALQADAAVHPNGDVTMNDVRPLAEKYYGKVPAGPLPQRTRPSEPPHVASQRISLADHVTVRTGVAGQTLDCAGADVGPVLVGGDDVIPLQEPPHDVDLCGHVVADVADVAAAKRPVELFVPSMIVGVALPEVPSPTKCRVVRPAKCASESSIADRSHDGSRP